MAIGDELRFLLASYQRELRYKGSSDDTFKTYTTSVTQFIEYAETTGAEELNAELFKDWIMFLRDDLGRSPATLLTRFASVRTFAHWIEREEGTPSFARGVPEPRVAEQPVPLLTVDQIGALLATCAGTGFLDRRDNALFRVLAEGGLRVREATRVTETDDLDMTQQVVWIHGKGGKMRAVPFGNHTAVALDRYLRVRRKHPRAARTPQLWIGHTGTLGPAGVRMIVQRRVAQAGLGIRVHPHMFRHTAAHLLRVAGMTDQDMMRIFGWRSRKMLERYGASAADERAIAAAHRLAIGDRF